MIIEQLLMLLLIVGRWMLPKESIVVCSIELAIDLKHFKIIEHNIQNQGDMTRDALAQLLLCYIGTAADIIEFFDSFKVIVVCSYLA